MASAVLSSASTMALPLSHPLTSWAAHCPPLLFDVLFVSLIYMGFGFYNTVVIPLIGYAITRRIPERAPPLLKLARRDRAYIAIAKLVTGLFVYHVYVFATNTSLSYMTVNLLDANALVRSLRWLPVHLIALFLVYDFFYTLFHWALHLPVLYPLIHKHHHRQMSPFRGNDDAINDHPLEYICGEYLHLWAIYLLTRMVPAGQVHAVTAVVFIFVGGTLASLNHTRIHVHIPYVFNVNAHDYHHRQPRVNFGQYVMFWDWVFGTYQAECTLPSDRARASARVKQM